MRLGLGGWLLLAVSLKAPEKLGSLAQWESCTFLMAISSHRDGSVWCRLSSEQETKCGKKT